MAQLEFGQYSLDTHKSELRYEGKALELEPQIYSILELLITRHGELVSRDDIINVVWNGRIMTNNVIDNRIGSARAAIGDTGKKQRYIKTYPNRGYKFIGKVRVIEAKDSPAKTIGTASALVAGRNRLEHNKRKGLQLRFTPSTMTIAAAALSGLFVFYFVSQAAISKIIETPTVIDEIAVPSPYESTLLGEANVLPRVAILPIETMGDDSAYRFFADVFENELNYTITAIKDITVVQFSVRDTLKNDFRDYQTLQNIFDLDYVIASNLSCYGAECKFNVSLIRVQDGVILRNDTYDVKRSGAADLKDLPAVIASKVTLMTANKLNLSVEALPQSWESYDFFAKIKEADAIFDKGDYESLKESAELFREAIQEEPNYIPAYSKLITALAWQSIFFVDDPALILKEQEELMRKMQDISPESPETLITIALMNSREAGVDKPEMGEYVENDPVSVSHAILDKDPDNQYATMILAGYSVFERDQAETVKAYEDAISLSPTEPWVQAEYSRALLCNGEIRKARAELDRASKWHPGHRKVILAEIRKARALGDYQTALTNIKQLLGQGYVNNHEAFALSSIFLDLGHPELALPHIRFAPRKAHIYAAMGEKEMALKEAGVIQNFYTSVRARMIVDENYFPKDYSVNRTYRKVGTADDTTKANACRLHQLIRDSYVLKETGSEKNELFFALLTEYFEDKNPEDLVTQQDYESLMGLHILQGDHDKAIEVMDIAMERGFIFIGAFKEPYLRDLAAHPGFAERLEKMQKSADLLIETYYLNL